MLCSQQKRTRCCSIHPGFRVGGANTIKSHGNSNDKGPSPRHPIDPPALVDGFEKRTKHSVHLRYRETKWTTTPQIVLYCPISKKNIVDKTTTIHPSIRLFSPQSLMMIQVIRKAFHINSSACGHTHQNKKEWIFISFRFDCLSCQPVLYALPACLIWLCRLQDAPIYI